MAFHAAVCSARQLPRVSLLTASFSNISLQATRSFSTTLPIQRAATLPAEIPPCPYGPRRTFKQADSGLYGGATIIFGNKISKGRNKGKTRRIWKPNVRKEKVYSKALDEEIELKVTHGVLRTINKVGGLDEYLLGDKPARIKELGMFGWKLRWRVMTSLAMKEKFALERQQLGLQEPETFEQFLARHSESEKIEAATEHDLRRQQEAHEAATPLTAASMGEMNAPELRTNPAWI
ncbi:50S ribosomal protein L24 [Trichophyton tonsurans CBS 112818]|uniref:Large ribosomal subunit protein bL28m n=1 Tax=Trichophyton tonsurans (strain CBS 112818) TaxID=647933 RepID=F2S314_TRIT1|nr:50S ribosomal protein L24 [Trichophyton tonsurans CBS 112818]